MKPIELYYWPTPNGHKITLLLEELHVPYRIIPINISKGDQFQPAFLKIAPNNRMPAIVDPEPMGQKTPLSIFESAAILLYLAEKHQRFLPQDPPRKYDVIQWLMWQMGGLGPMAGQAHHFRIYAQEKLEYAINRYTDEVNRLYGVMNQRLADRDYLAGEYSVADMAAWPWVKPYERQGQDLNEFPHLKRWFETIGERPAVKKALSVGEEYRMKPEDLTDEDRKMLFGQRARKA